VDKFVSGYVFLCFNIIPREVFIKEKGDKGIMGYKRYDEVSFAASSSERFSDRGHIGA